MIEAFMELKTLHRLYDAATGRLEATTGVPSCIAGCSRCCQHASVLASIIEGINMYSVLIGQGQGRLDKAIERAEGWLLEPHGAQVFEGMPVGLKGGRLVDEWNMISKVQCAFLEGNSCTIYEVRPLVCRSYGIFRDAADICPRPLGRGESESRRCVMDGRQAQKLQEEFFARCRKKNPQWAIRGFAPAMLFRAAKPKKLQEHIEANRISSAKLVGVDLDYDLSWQPQLDALRSGVKPVELLMPEFYDGPPDPAAVLR